MLQHCLDLVLRLHQLLVGRRVLRPNLSRHRPFGGREAIEPQRRALAIIEPGAITLGQFGRRLVAGRRCAFQVVDAGCDILCVLAR